MHGDELSGASAELVNRLSDQLLSGSAFARNADRRTRRSDLPDVVDHPLDRRRVADDVLHAELGVQAFPELLILLFDAAPTPTLSESGFQADRN